MPPRHLARLERGLRRRTSAVGTRARTRWRRARRHVLVIGDSHAEVFRHPSWSTVPVRFDVTAVGGATLSGLGNLESATGARRRFDTALTRASTARTTPRAVVLLLGEVDCGFVLWKRHERNGQPVAELLTPAIENYRQFIAATQIVAPAVVISAPLPTLTDLSAIGDYAGQRREIRASRPERTALVRELNARCRAVCDELDCTFVDLDPLSLGADGEVSPLLVSPDRTDHHYDPVVYARTLQRALAPVLGYELGRTAPDAAEGAP